jgi:hypothetical protein
VREAAIVQSQVRKDAGFFVGTIGLDKSAFVLCEMDETTLQEKSVAGCFREMMHLASSSRTTRSLRDKAPFADDGGAWCPPKVQAIVESAKTTANVNTNGRAEYRGRGRNPRCLAMDRASIV